MIKEKIVIGILNWGRSSSIVKKMMNKIAHCGEIVIATNQPEEYKSPNKIILTNENVAKSKNMILDKAVELGAQWCFIIEDDMKIIDNSIFNRYINLMKELECPIMMYGFGGGNNKVFENFPNPAVEIILSTSKSIIFNRHPCSGFMAFMLDKGIRFDERLKIFETNYMLQNYLKNSKDNLGYLNGFYPDIKDSYKYFTREDVPTIRKKTNEDIIHDRNLMGCKENMYEKNGDLMINIVKEKLNRGLLKNV